MHASILMMRASPSRSRSLHRSALTIAAAARSRSSSAVSGPQIAHQRAGSAYASTAGSSRRSADLDSFEAQRLPRRTRRLVTKGAGEPREQLHPLHTVVDAAAGRAPHAGAERAASHRPPGPTRTAPRNRARPERRVAGASMSRKRTVASRNVAFDSSVAPARPGASPSPSNNSTQPARRRPTATPRSRSGRGGRLPRTRAAPRRPARHAAQQGRPSPRAQTARRAGSECAIDATCGSMLAA